MNFVVGSKDEMANRLQALQTEKDKLIKDLCFFKDWEENSNWQALQIVELKCLLQKNLLYVYGSDLKEHSNDDD